MHRCRTSRARQTAGAVTGIATTSATRYPKAALFCRSSRPSSPVSSPAVTGSANLVAAHDAIQSSLPRTFVCTDLSDPRRPIVGRTDDPVAVYARFFIHAITDDG